LNLTPNATRSGDLKLRSQTRGQSVAGAGAYGPGIVRGPDGRRDVVHLLCVFDHGADTSHGAVITTLDCQAIGKAQWQCVSASIRRLRSAWKARLQPPS